MAYTQADLEKLYAEVKNFREYESYGDRAVRRSLNDLMRQIAFVEGQIAAQTPTSGRLRVTVMRFRR
jgi:hypothetical protein